MFMMSPTRFVLVLCLIPICLVVCENPCIPNPCGENTRCLMQPGVSEDQAVISCQCLPGFTQNPSGAFEGCVSSEPIAFIEDSESDTSSSSSTTTTTGRDSTTETSTTTTTTEAETSTTTDRPHLFPTSKTVIGFDSDGGEVLFHAAITPKSDIISGGVDDLNPIELSQNDPTTSTPTTPTTDVTSSDVLKNPNILSLPLPPHIEDLDREAILTEECLVNEDCPVTDFCDVAIRKCKSACSTNVCGTGADCKGRLHRPVCFCPKGFEGNPQQKCEKAQSRAGTKFRRRR